MPRRVAVQVPQTVSRLLQGGYLKATPLAYPALLSHPPASLPPRAPVPRPLDDLPRVFHPPPPTRSSSRPPAVNPASSSSSNQPATPRRRQRDPRNASKKLRSQTPSLHPRPIVYLADEVRVQFYDDHPWEVARPRTLVEGRRVDVYEGGQGSTMRKPAGWSDDELDGLEKWGKNPSPEDVISCTIHLHQHHQLSLSHAYQRTVSSYHALRAEHEHASRYALLEARAHGATFLAPHLEARRAEWEQRNARRSASRRQDDFRATFGLAAGLRRLGGGSGMAAADDVMRRARESAAVETTRGYLKEESVLADAAREMASAASPLGAPSAADGDDVVVDGSSTVRRVKSSDDGSRGFTGGEAYLVRALRARDVARGVAASSASVAANDVAAVSGGGAGSGGSASGPGSGREQSEADALADVANATTTTTPVASATPASASRSGRGA